MKGDEAHTLKALAQRREAFSATTATLVEFCTQGDAAQRVGARIDAAAALLRERMFSQPALRVGSATSMHDARLLKTRYHGDLHLGQALVTGGDFIITGFEGEPARPLSERRRRHCPLRDVAGMLRSFSYAAATTGDRLGREHEAKRELILAVLGRWEGRASEAFLQGYLDAAIDLPSVPAGDREAMLALIELFALEKLLYEIRYELNNRPEWSPIPLRGLAALTGDMTTPAVANAP